MRRIVADVAPRFVFAENVQKRAIDRAADDLKSMAYAVKCLSLSTLDVGGDHIRRRHWVLAYADRDGELLRAVHAKARLFSRIRPRVWETYPDESRVADGVAHWVDRLEATGNGQVPCVAIESKVRASTLTDPEGAS
jgi:DNA (cytosine-5)-methyltransferase 1